MVVEVVLSSISNRRAAAGWGQIVPLTVKGGVADSLGFEALTMSSTKEDGFQGR